MEAEGLISGFYVSEPLIFKKNQEKRVQFGLDALFILIETCRNISARTLGQAAATDWKISGGELAARDICLGSSHQTSLEFADG